MFWFNLGIILILNIIATSILILVPCTFYYFVLWPTNAQLIHKLLHSYTFRHYRVILKELVISTLPSYTGLFEMIVGVLTTCHTQYTWDRSICVFYLFNRTTLQVFVTYLISALYEHPLWFYKHQHDNRVRSKLFVACQRWWFQWQLIRTFGSGILAGRGGT